MIFVSCFKRLKNNLYVNYSFYTTLISSSLSSKGFKRAYLQIEDIIPNRYLYNFLKFFKICGYTLYLPKNKQLVATLHKKDGEFQYGSWILKEGIKLGEPKKPYLLIGRKKLSNDYFNKKRGVNAYHVPMSEYPEIYLYDLQLPIIKETSSRKNSVFMSGNIDKRVYDNLSNSPFFSIPSRLSVYNYLKNNSELYHEVTSYEELSDFIQSDIDKKIVIVDSSNHFRLPLRQLKNTLVNFNFYLALPGVCMPQCHNLIEAMSVGCIPIIHLTYAKEFEPSLKHYHNAIIYEGLEEVEKIIKESLELDLNFIQRMKNNVIKYYKENLSPQGVVNKIENNSFSKIYIHAEIASLKLLKQHE